RWHGERPCPGSIRDAANGKIRNLPAITDRVVQSAPGGYRLEQENGATVCVETESCVCRTGRGEWVTDDDIISPGGDDDAWRKNKLPRCGRIVAQTGVG